MNQFGAAPSQPPSSETLFPGFPTLDLGRLLDSVKRRLWLAVLVTLAIVGLAVAYVVLAPEVYESSAVIYVEPKNEGSAFNGIRGANQASWESLDALKSMAGGIANGNVILRVVERLGLRDDPDFLEPKEGGYTDAEMVEIVGERVEAELRRGTRLIDVSVQDESPERARDMAAAFIDEFQALIREQNQSSSKRSRELLEKEAANQLERVLAAEEKLQEFRMRHTDLALDEDKDYESKKLEDLETMLGEAESQVIQRRSEFEQYQSIPDEEIERVFEIGSYGNADHIQKLLLARNQKRAEFVKIRKQYGPEHPTYQSYESDLEGLEEEVKRVARGVGDSIEKAYQRAVEHEENLREKVREQRRELIEVDGIRKEFRTLKRAVDSAYSTYESLLDRINDTDVTEGVDETVVRVFSEPLVPAEPVSPRKKLTVVIAGFFGSMSGLALVVGLGLLDRTLNSRSQVESTLGLAVLAEVPRPFDTEWELKESLFVTRDPGSLVSESIRSLRTSLSAHSPRSVMITSAEPGEGKSFCAANLAVLQANMGYRTLLVDADFCRPRMSELFVEPLRGEAGEGEVATQNLCQETIYEELYLLSCGRVTSNTGEPMSGEIFARMMHEAYASFDCVIVDTSPINAVSDGLTYSRHTDSVVLVVRAGQTKADSAKRAIRELQRMRSNLVGCVLNGSREVSPGRLAYVEGANRSLATAEPRLAPTGSSA